MQVSMIRAKMIVKEEGQHRTLDVGHVSGQPLLANLAPNRDAKMRRDDELTKNEK